MISVCMATYNGEKTLPRQLHSILKQLSAADEMVLVDDGSTDATWALCRDILAQYPVQVQMVQNPSNCGPVRSFEKALSLAKGDYIFFSDQDDEWLPNKVAVCMNIFQTQHAELIFHDARVVDGNFQTLEPSWNAYKGNRNKISVARNLWKNGLAGSMMALTKKLRADCLPFPPTIQMHDQWIFLKAKKKGYRIVLSAEILINYVRHGQNATGFTTRSKKEMFMGRLNMVKCYLYK